MTIQTDTPAEPTEAAPNPATEPEAKGDDAGILDDLQIEDTQPAPDNKEMDPPVEDVGANEDEPTKEVKEEKKKDDGEVEPEKPAKPDKEGEAEPEDTPKLLAGEFETQEQLETAFKDQKIAYSESSKEGRRLSGELDNLRDQSSSELKTKDLKIARLDAQVKAGPKPVEATDEEIDAMTPAQLLRYNKKHEDWNQRQREMEREEKLDTEKVESESRETRDYVVARSKAMSEDEKNFPGYSKLVPEMDELMDYAPDTLGHRKSPEILYYAAVGVRALKNAEVAKTAKSKSEETARGKAGADAARGGGPGASKSPKTPAGGVRKSPDQETDEEYNDRQILAAKESGGSYFQ